MLFVYEKNKDVDQRLCYHYKILQLPYFLNFKLQASSHLYCCIAQFLSDLVGNTKDKSWQGSNTRSLIQLFYSFFVLEKLRVYSATFNERYYSAIRSLYHHMIIQCSCYLVKLMELGAILGCGYTVTN